MSYSMTLRRLPAGITKAVVNQIEGACVFVWRSMIQFDCESAASKIYNK